MAALDPESGAWTIDPETPLTPRSGVAATWTGEVLLVWGGALHNGFYSEPLSDGARSRPGTPTGPASSSPTSRATDPSDVGDATEPSPSNDGTGLPVTRVVAGQMMMVGGPYGAADDPAPGTVTAVDGSGAEVARADTDADGRFELHLPAGAFRVRGRSPSYRSGDVDCAADGEVVVADADLVGVTVVCLRR